MPGTSVDTISQTYKPGDTTAARRVLGEPVVAKTKPSILQRILKFFADL